LLYVYSDLNIKKAGLPSFSGNPAFLTPRTVAFRPYLTIGLALSIHTYVLHANITPQQRTYNNISSYMYYNSLYINELWPYISENTFLSIPTMAPGNIQKPAYFVKKTDVPFS